MKISEHVNENKNKILMFFILIALFYESRILFEEKYTWAFAQELNGHLSSNEYCRQTLADSIYLEENSKKTSREGKSNIFIYSGLTQAYRIFGFKNQNSCEIMLENLKQAQD